MNRFFYISPWILQTLIWIPTRIFFRVFRSYKVSGLENIKNLKSKGGVIFAVNHSSELDPVMIPASLPFLSGLMPMFYVSREQTFYANSGWRRLFYGGLFFNLWGAHNAYVGLKNYELSLRHHIQILNDGKSLCIFPEGRKTRDGNIGEGKAGTAFLAHRTNSPIVPVKIKGLFKPQIQKDSLNRKKIEVIFGEPIWPADLFGDTQVDNIGEYKKATQKIMEKIKNL